MNIKNITLIATCTFGLEAVVKRELQILGFGGLVVSNGNVAFAATLADIPRANLWLRTADRVLLKLGEFRAVDFDQLFKGVEALPWEQWIPKDSKITVTGKSIKSRLASVRANQSIVKKAILKRLGHFYKNTVFPETGLEMIIQVALCQDQVLITLDTTGPGLNRRGYRAQSGEVPLKETLAAALVLLSYWQPRQILVDPMCGSGTILIEAAMIALQIAPGLRRSFTSESWSVFSADLWEESRVAAKNLGQQSGDISALRIFGLDDDPDRIADARKNARRIGVEDDIVWQCADVRNLSLDDAGGVLITNPPYGVKLGADLNLPDIYRALANLYQRNHGWAFNVLTADRKFSGIFQARQKFDRRRVRKLYNGTLEVNFYQYDIRV